MRGSEPETAESAIDMIGVAKKFENFAQRRQFDLRRAPVFRVQKSTLLFAIAGTATTARSTHATTRSEVRRARVRFSSPRVSVRCRRARGFLETTGGEGPRVSRPLRRANFFKICPRSSPALFSSISRARRCPSSASFSAGESRDDRHSDDRARRLLRRLLCPSRDRSPSLTFPSLSRDVFPSARVSLFAHARKPFVCPAFLLSTKIHGPT